MMSPETLADLPRPRTETEQRLHQARVRVAESIADAAVEVLLPKLAERPTQPETWDFIMFRLEQDGARIDRLVRVSQPSSLGPV